MVFLSFLSAVNSNLNNRRNWKQFGCIVGNEIGNFSNIYSDAEEFLFMVRPYASETISFKIYVPKLAFESTIFGSAKSNDMGEDYYGLLQLSGEQKSVSVPYIIHNGSYLTTQYSVYIYYR